MEVFFLRLKENRIISENEYEQLVADDYTDAIRIIQTSSFIVATNSNARLIQQRGAFLLSSAVNVKTRADVKTSVLSKAKLDLDKEFEGCFIIPAKDKDEIRRELDFFNVNEATLFPELEHQMRYIQNQTIISVGTVEEYIQYSKIITTDVALDVDFVRKHYKKMNIDIAGYIPKKLSDVNDDDEDEFCHMFSAWFMAKKGVLLGRIIGEAMPAINIPVCYSDAIKKAQEIAENA